MKESIQIGKQTGCLSSGTHIEDLQLSGEFVPPGAEDGEHQGSNLLVGEEHEARRHHRLHQLGVQALEEARRPTLPGVVLVLVVVVVLLLVVVVVVVV